MSTNDLLHIGMRTGFKEIGKTKAKVNHKVKIVSAFSHNYHLILGLSCLSFGIVVALLMIVQPTMTSHYGSTSMDDPSKCTEKVDFERIGHYTSQAQFKIAELFCFNILK